MKYQDELKYPVDGFGIPMELYTWIRDNIKEGSTILELGSGPSSTGNLSQFYTMYSIEHDPKYVNRYNSTYIYAPRKDGWFDKDIVAKGIKDIKYDAIIVDGPPIEGRRQGFVTNIKLFDVVNKPIIVDDTHRQGEIKLIKDIASILNREYKIFTENKQHGYGVVYHG